MLAESSTHWGRKFIVEVERAVQDLKGRPRSAVASELDSDLLHFEALVLILQRAAELMAQERGLDPRQARQAMALVSRGLGPAPDRILTGFDERISQIREAPRTPTAFLGMSYEALYGQSSAASEPGAKPSSLYRRDNGVFFTPPTMADLLTASGLSNPAVAEQGLDLSILDPACGPATFLAASLNYLSRATTSPGEPSRARVPNTRRAIAERCLFGVDRDATAVAVARTVLWLEVGDSSFDPVALGDRIVCADSLTLPLGSWAALFPTSSRILDAVGVPRFGVILTNPPWGAIKPLRREFIAHVESLGARDGVGETRASDLVPTLDEMWNEYVSWTRGYAVALLRSPDFGSLRKRDPGDIDLYQFFMHRMFSLLRDDGRIGMVIPAAFQRTIGASELRRLYLDNGRFEQIAEIINRERVFPIHGMFRFLLATYQKGAERGVGALKLGLSSVEEVSRPQIQSESAPGPLDLNFIQRVGGHNLMIPDVHTRAEADLLGKLYSQHPTLGTAVPSTWSVHFRRELDMTRDAVHFVQVATARQQGWNQRADGTWTGDQGTFLPVYEGRMINQFDSAAKGYRCGSGRQAVWEPLPGDRKNIEPQFLVPMKLAKDRGIRLTPRAAFCDVSGHANERTVLASVVPAMAVCGNKVPVCVFEADDERLPILWSAIANSFVIDWIIRRWVSTTINYFYWWNVPFPRLDPGSEIGTLLVERSARLHARLPGTNPLSVNGEHSPATPEERQELRAEIDATLARLFQLSPDEFDLILSDFSLVDRFQPRVDGGSEFITKDLAMATFLRGDQSRRSELESLETRVQRSRKAGALGYVPSESAAVTRRLAPKRQVPTLTV